MNYRQLRDQLGQEDLQSSKMFEVLGQIAGHVNNKETHNQGRDLVIRALARRDLCGEFETRVLASLVRNVGLYPYLSPMLESVEDDDFLAYELHRPDGLDAVFHSLQARIYYQLRSGSNVVLSASTSVGKSLLIDAMVALGKFKKVVVVLPTLALIDETRKRLASKFRERCHLITHPTQVARSDKINVYVLTQERVRHRIDLSNIDFFVVDEFYKLDFRRDDDKQRAIELNLAFHQLATTGAQFYLLGPNVQSIKGLDKYEFHFIPSDYSTVAVDVVQFDLPSRGDDRPNKLAELAQLIEGSTLIYCQGPGSAVKVGRRLMRSVEPNNPESCAATAHWMADNYHPEWAAVAAVQHGIGLHHGGIPRALQQHMVRMFNDGSLKFLVCTSTLIEGVNTAAKNVIVYDRRRNKNVLDFFTYKNIQGRAGRMGTYFVGKVYMLEKPPVDDDVVVEYPIGEQSEETPLTLLLQLDDDELSDFSKSRVEDAIKNSFLSADTLRLNGSVPPDIQNRIAGIVYQKFKSGDVALVWSGFPKHFQLIAVCEIIVNELSGPRLNDLGISSGRQLAWHLSTLSQADGIPGYLAEIARGTLAHQVVSDRIDEALKVIRNVITFQFPRDLMVLDRIISEVANRLEMAGPNYSVYAEATENLFLPPAIAALEEYGIPVQIAKKLSAYLHEYDLDRTLDDLRALDLGKVENLSAFERTLVGSVQSAI
ncbi:DEAD/DEAH box helicase [Bradyrhizobium sp. WYCCWR 12699]|uniref:DEAD/DEAH box helicase n=1 Tax=Bradyrhizobium sp. WYCCWR 12699 TaxID=3064203 RepID=UPI0028A53304|nr:DEAD/DEAH box helicase [Bradyrhizobium sp. WYCCWR 12699]MDT4739806.1 helicase-related protein [Bradyrhizobium sp. WYCCWR 12699]